MSASAGEEVVKPTEAELELVTKLMSLDLSGDVWERKNVDRVVRLIRQYISGLPTSPPPSGPQYTGHLGNCSYWHSNVCDCTDAQGFTREVAPPSARPAEHASFVALRPAIDSACRFIEEQVAPRKCDAEASADCVRCASVAIARWLQSAMHFIVTAPKSSTLGEEMKPAIKVSLEQAIWIASEAHSGQLDKGGQPYILHPLRVMLAMDTNEERAVAVLHDVVEDTDVSLDEIADALGADIAEGVDAVTRRTGESYEDYITRAGKHPIGRKVKIADLYDNLDPVRLAQLTSRTRLENKYRGALAQLGLIPSASAPDAGKPCHADKVRAAISHRISREDAGQPRAETRPIAERIANTIHNLIVKRHGWNHLAVIGILHHELDELLPAPSAPASAARELAHAICQMFDTQTWELRFTQLEGEIEELLDTHIGEQTRQLRDGYNSMRNQRDYFENLWRIVENQVANAKERAQAAEAERGAAKRQVEQLCGDVKAIQHDYHNEHQEVKRLQAELERLRKEAK